MHLAYLICSEIGKIRSTKDYWRKIKSYFQVSLILLQFSSMVVYIVREVNMENGSGKFLTDEDASDFYYINQLSHDFLVIQGKINFNEFYSEGCKLHPIRCKL